MRKIPDIYIHPPHSNTIFMTILVLDSFDYSCYQGSYENSDLGPKFLGNQKLCVIQVVMQMKPKNEVMLIFLSC